LAGILYPDGKDADPVVDFGKAELLRNSGSGFEESLA